MPIQTLFNTLARGDAIDGFLKGFEGVSREQALAALALAGDDLLEDLAAL